VSDIPAYERYLGVSPQGIIVSDSWKRVDRPGSETWLCEYFGAHLTVTKLYPDRDVTRLIQIHPALQESIRNKFNEHTRHLQYNARHESGHAVLCYALRFRPVNQIDLRLGVLPAGNLFAHIRAGVITEAPRFIGGTTSIAWSEEDLAGLDTQGVLGVACQGLGGVAACPEFDKGAKSDLDRVLQMCRALAGLVQAPSHEQHNTAITLNERLRTLVDEILANPVVADRRRQLVEELLKTASLDREAVEAILVPQTLPDYSDRIRQIQSEFKIPHPK
jgi:hypothetical protein